MKKIFLAFLITAGLHASAQQLSVFDNGHFLYNTAIDGQLSLPKGATNGFILTSDATGNANWASPSSIGMGTAWSLNGNSGTNSLTNFIGTTDNQALILKAYNTVVGYLDDMNTVIGFNPLSYKGTPPNSPGVLTPANLKASTFLGRQVGQGTSNMYGCIGVSSSTGNGAYYGANNDTGYIVIGDFAGGFAINVKNSISIGNSSGWGDIGLNECIRIGQNDNPFAGGSGSKSNAMAIGNNTQLISNNSFNIGNLLFATDMTSTSSSSPAGNVGIGTTTPSQKLEVAGAIKTAQPTANGAGAVLFGKLVTGTGGVNKYWEISVDGTTYYIPASTTLPQ